jgi:large subunit ribosomal protein L2
MGGVRVLKKYLVGDVVGRSSGRNVDGHITVHHRGGGVKNRYRILSKLGASIAGLVVDIVYDPTRTAKLAIVSWGNGLISQIICPTNVVVGSWINNVQSGARVLLIECEPKQLVYSVECFKYGFGACAAGTACKVRRKVVVGGRELIGLILPSKQLYFVSNLVSGRVGLVGNRQWQLTILKKAGRNRNLGRRPTVRGVAMNPVDHPHGGGEGKSSGGRISVSRWGWLTKGGRSTRHKKQIVY